ncbi:MAG: hypothetical protein N2202_06715 [Proteobacteria bacterium]|nr:hypothetical protein [Pseudomonadota bacterium]
MDEKEKPQRNYDSIIDSLLRRSLEFKSSDKFLKFVNFLVTFRKYSCFNNMLVYIQNPNIIFFGSRKFWEKHKRYVKLEAKPYIILVPHGPVNFVYDLFDTYGKETPQEFIEKGIGFKPFEVKGQIEREKLESIINNITEWRIDVYYDDMNYFQAGYVVDLSISKSFKICLNKSLTHTENFGTLTHELAHIFLGHVGNNKVYHRKEKDKFITLPVRKKLDKKIKELEAETVSYLLCARMGLQTSSLEYLAGYISSEEDLKIVSYEMIARATDKIEKLFF